MKDIKVTPELSAKIVKEAKEYKKVKVTAPVVELVSYSIKAVIPTGSYANIQPEIIVKAKSLEEADRFVMPYIRRLYQEYAPSVLPQVTYAVSQSPVVEMKKAMETPTVMTTAESLPHEPVTTVTEATAPFLKAEQALNGCKTQEALTLIEQQISKSVKLSKDEKFALLKLVSLKADEFFKAK